MQRILIALILALAPVLALAALDKPPSPGAKVAFLGMTFTDPSTEGAYNGVRADETAQFKLLESAAPDRFAQEGLHILSNYSVATELAKLVLSINLVLGDAPSGTILRGLAVDIRSNADGSRLRGIRYILNNHFFKS